MGDELTLTIPVPPSVNHAYATVKGRRVLSIQGRQFKNDVGRRALFGKGKWYYPKGARLSLSLALHFKDGRRRDISNTVKLCEDAFSECFGFDDCCVDVLHVERKENDKSNPRCVVTLEVLSDT